MDPWCGGRKVARGVLLTLLKRAKTSLFAIGEGSRFLVVCFYTRAAKSFFSQTPGRRPTHVTGRHLNTVVFLGWVQAPNERAPFRVHDAVIVFVDQCLTRSQIANQGVGFH